MFWLLVLPLLICVWLANWTELVFVFFISLLVTILIKKKKKSALEMKQKVEMG